METNNLTAGETLLITLVFAHKKKVKKFSADREKLHRFFHSQKEKHSAELRTLLFLEKDIFPESTLLDQAISSMEAGGLLQRLNNRPRFYEMTDKVEKAYENFVKQKVNAETEDRFNMIAEEFIKTVGEE